MQKSSKIRLEKLVFAALMVAMTILIGMFCKNYLTFFGTIRITFENIPVIITGMLLGPAYGGAVGLVADLVTAPSTGSVNPIITVGAAAIGIVSGMMKKFVFRNKHGFLPTLLCVMPAHAVGSMVIKSFGLWYMYSYAIELCLARIPLYLAIGLAETYIIYYIYKNKWLVDTLSGGKK